MAYVQCASVVVIASQRSREALAGSASISRTDVVVAAVERMNLTHTIGSIAHLRVALVGVVASYGDEGARVSSVGKADASIVSAVVVIITDYRVKNATSSIGRGAFERFATVDYCETRRAIDGRAAWARIGALVASNVLMLAAAYFVASIVGAYEMIVAIDGRVCASRARIA